MTILTHTKIIDLSILIAAVTLLIVVTVLPVMYKMQAMDDMRAKTIIDLTAKGVDPIAARCSIAPDKDSLCLVYVATKHSTPNPK